MPTVNNSLHLVEQRKRTAASLLCLAKVRSALEDLVKNAEVLHYWQIAEGNALSLFKEIKEAREAEELKRASEVEAAFNSKTLFSDSRFDLPKSHSFSPGGGR